MVVEIKDYEPGRHEAYFCVICAGPASRWTKEIRGAKSPICKNPRCRKAAAERLKRIRIVNTSGEEIPLENE